MIRLIRKYKDREYINEKFAVQQYADKLKRLFTEDKKFFAKNNELIFLSLMKNKLFCLERLMSSPFGINGAEFLHIFYVLYNKRKDITKYDVEMITGIKNPVEPKDCGGFHRNGIIVVYIPCYTYRFYGDKTLEDKIFDELKNLSDNLIKDRDSHVVAMGYDKPYYPREKEIKEACRECYKNLRENIEVRDKYAYETLLHEFTHYLDKISGASKTNYFTTINNKANTQSSDSSEISKIEQYVTIILYHLWSRTEFNAYQLNTGNKVDVIKLYIEELKNYKFDNKEDETFFWEVVKQKILIGTYDKELRSRIANKSPQQIKTYFIKTSDTLLQKFIDKLDRNKSIQNMYRKDKENLANQIKSEIGYDKHKKREKFSLVLNFDFYFPQSYQGYPVTMTFNTPPYSEMKRNGMLARDKVYADTVLNIKCRPLKFDQNIRAIDIFRTHQTSFYDLYLELTDKCRKTQIAEISERLAVDITDVLPIIEDLIINGKADSLTPPWLRDN